MVDEANPDDPNELSFTKGQVLHVHERKGNWWQARQADGTVGMIPSNYVSCLAFTATAEELIPRFVMIGDTHH